MLVFLQPQWTGLHYGLLEAHIYNTKTGVIEGKRFKYLLLTIISAFTNSTNNSNIIGDDYYKEVEFVDDDFIYYDDEYFDELGYKQHSSLMIVFITVCLS